MADTLYSEDELFELGRKNYGKLVLYCTRLEENGFWAQAEKVMKQSSAQVLDLYVQSVLMNLAVHCGEILDSQREFMRVITVSNPLGIPTEGKIKSVVYDDSRRLYELPPILLQLCGLYDKQNRGDMTEYFLDAFLNILLCMAYLDTGKDEKISKFIQQYYEKISNFIIDRDAKTLAEYIIRKLSSKEIKCDAEYIIKGNIKVAAVTIPASQVIVKPKAAAKAQQEEAKPHKVKKKELEKEEAKLSKIKKEELEKEEVKLSKIKKKELEREEAKLSKIKKKELEREEAKLRKIKKKELEREEARRKEEEELARKEAERKKKQREEFFKRVQENEERLAKEQFLAVKERIKERERAAKEEQERRIKAIMDELNSLVGLSDVKKEIQSLTNLIKIRKLRESMNMPVMDMSYHMVFTGSPGTGKTTVARLVGKIYKELGILTDGKMIETDRSGLVAGYVGQTAIKVHDVIEQAIGGVLFIDEAYSLVNPDVPNDFGMEAVDALVKLMEDHRDNLVIIVAGYTEEMKTFLKSNTGLISRFNKFIGFPDYTKDELLEIMDVMAQQAGLMIEDTAKDKILARLEGMKEEEWEDFGNARGIRNMFEKIVMNQADRLVMIEEPEKEQIMTIIADDV